jgi:KaiC/GvpD/RAD55 family RecA-like ATPase
MAITEEPIKQVLRGLDGVRRSGEGWVAKCPAHEDHKPSLTVGLGKDGRVLLCCQKGCDTESIVGKLDLTLGDLFVPDDKSKAKSDEWEVVDTYTYHDAEGKPIFQVRRTKGKQFPQYHRENGEWKVGRGGAPYLLYHLPQLLEGIRAGKPVFVVEGEKDVRNLERLGFVATCNPGGASNSNERSKWRSEYTEHLKGATVYVVPDNDEPGRKHAAAVLESLKGKADARLLDLPGLPDKGDASDWIAAGGTAAKLTELCAATGRQSVACGSFEAMYRCLEDITRRKNGEIKGLPWPKEWSDLSKTLGPIEPGTFTVVAARPSVGKTIFASQLQAFLCDEGHRVYYVTRELTPERLVRRHLVRQGAVMDNLRSGQITATDEEAIEKFRVQQSGWQVRYDHRSNTIADISWEAQNFGAELVIVDYLQRMAYETEKEYAAITRLVNDFQDFTLATGIPLLLISQLTRPIKGQEHTLPSMSDTRGSGAVEERATTLVLLHRDWATREDESQGRKRKVATMKLETGVFFVAKNADGEADISIPIKVNGARMDIREEKPWHV